MSSQLPPGTKLGRYEIRSLIGAGGMGEVYRARDLKLSRDVAVKVLPAAFSSDAGRLQRFEQEAQAAGALNHPNILTVYDVGTHEGAPYVISELLEGETLRDVLSAGPVSPRKSIHYATSIAHGLAAAHERGIVHRDLKPDNLFVTTDDRIKILDFGLAKLVQPSNLAIVQTEIATLKVNTSAGTVMGTVGYMSPEQVRGERVDHRSDIFSFGAVLYELLSGRRAFHADSPVESLNAILRHEPEDLTSTDARINPQLDKILRRCLEKKPERRFQSASDLSFALEALTATSEPLSSTQSLRHVQREFKATAWLPWVLAGAMLIAALVLGWLYFGRTTNNEFRPAKLMILPPANTFLMAGQPPVISPDGQTLVFVAMDPSGKSMLYARPLGSDVARPLEGSDGAVLPFWSPDSTKLGFFAQGKLKRTNVAGGQPTTLASAPVPRGGTWSRDGIIIYCPTPPSTLMRIPAEGGPPTPLNTGGTDQVAVGRWLPFFLPDGRHFLYVTRRVHEVRVGSIDSTDSKLIVRAESNAVFVNPGYLFYRRESKLVARRFDPDKLELKGDAIPLADNVGFDAVSLQGYFSGSDNGVVVYHSGAAGHTQLTWLDRTGKQISIVGDPADQGDLQLSPDDSRVAFRRVDSQSTTINLWLMDLARVNASRFTFEQTTDFAPVWSSDGNRIVFASLRDGSPNLYQKVATGAGNEEPFLKSSLAKVPFDWSRDGKFIIYGVIDPKTSWDLWFVPVADLSKAAPFLQTDADELQAQFSPDGHWVAYVSNESGHSEVYVRPFPTAAGKWQVSTDGGIQPRWRADGKELFYLASDHKLMSVEVIANSSNFDHRSPTALFSTRVGGIDSPGDYYAVTSDGKRFILNNLVAEGAYTPITVVLNWGSELKR